MQPVAEVCRYSPRHFTEGVPATTVIDCGAAGLVPSCEACAELYVRLSRGRPARPSQES